MSTALAAIARGGTPGVARPSPPGRATVTISAKGGTIMLARAALPSGTPPRGSGDARLSSRATETVT